MKGDYQRNRFRCESCASVAHGRPLPDEWVGFGTSMDGGTAHWCPACVKNGTMANESRPHRSEAAAVAKRRGRLLQAVAQAEDR